MSGTRSRAPQGSDGSQEGHGQREENSRVVYPKLTPTLDIVEDEEHQSNKVTCRLHANGLAIALL